jgi:hypothetical protein
MFKALFGIYSAGMLRKWGRCPDGLNIITPKSDDWLVNEYEGERCGISKAVAKKLAIFSAFPRQYLSDIPNRKHRHRDEITVKLY